jgi:CubicO group peptidase (beta-lactamase class C family)
VLAVLVRAATGTTLSTYLTARLWQPMGAEADATWVKTPDEVENGGGGFNAVLRDYGRLGVLLANDGAVGPRQVLPKDYLLEATDWRRHPEAFAPRKARPTSAMATSSGRSRATSAGSRCSASTAKRSSSIRS